MNAEQEARGNGAAWLVALTSIWLWTWHDLAREWYVNEQYHYGFAVPVLFIFLLRKNWRGDFTGKDTSWKLNGGAVAAWLLFLFAEFLQRQDPMWRMAGALMMVSTTLITTIWIYRCGGTPLIRQLWFPLAFAWLALPWPVSLELLLTQNLLKFLTGATATVMNWLGIAALQQGNLIELRNGFVGMDTACSGVQSLQAAFFISILFGELYRLGWKHRIGLLLSGGIIAFLSNFGRVFFLTWTMHSQGENAMNQWHDSTGYVASFSTFFLILLLAGRLESMASRNHRSAGTSSFQKGLRLAGIDGYCILATFLCIPLMAWLWCMLLNPQAKTSAPLWILNTESLAAGWKTEPVEATSNEKAGLHFNEMQGFRLTGPYGQESRILHFYWKPERGMTDFAYFHTPQICMPTIGWENETLPVPATIRIQGVPMPCLKYQFKRGDLREVAFRSLGAAGASSVPSPGQADSMSRRNRIARLWKNSPNPVNEELLIYLKNSGTEKKQIAEAEEMLNQIVHTNSQSR